LPRRKRGAPGALDLRELRDGLVTLERGQQQLSTLLTLHGNRPDRPSTALKATSVTWTNCLSSAT
jgi:hypothetical protein